METDRSTGNGRGGGSGGISTGGDAAKDLRHELEMETLKADVLRAKQEREQLRIDHEALLQRQLEQKVRQPHAVRIDHSLLMLRPQLS